MIVAAASACDAARASTDGIGNAERKTAAVTPAGRHAARRIARIDPHRLQHAIAVGPVHQANRELLALAKMQRDVAAIVDIGAIERRCRQHRAKDFLCHTAGDGRHRRDEAIRSEWGNGRMHAARNRSLQRATQGMSGLAQLSQFGAQLVEQAAQAARRRRIGGANVGLPTIRLDDQIDRAILQMQPPAVGKQRDLRQPRHARRPGFTPHGIGRMSETSFSVLSGRT